MNSFVTFFFKLQVAFSMDQLFFYASSPLIFADVNFLQFWL